MLLLLVWSKSRKVFLRRLDDICRVHILIPLGVNLIIVFSQVHIACFSYYVSYDGVTLLLLNNVIEIYQFKRIDWAQMYTNLLDNGTPRLIYYHIFQYLSNVFIHHSCWKWKFDRNVFDRITKRKLNNKKILYYGID